MIMEQQQIIDEPSPIRRSELFLELVDRYPSLATEQERAMIEARLWGLAEPQERRDEHRKEVRAPWLQKLLGLRSLYELRLRDWIFRTDIQELWDRVDRDHMALGTAYRLLLRARTRGKLSGEPIRQLVLEELAAHDQVSVPVRTRKGKAFRRRGIPDKLRGTAPASVSPKDFALKTEARGWVKVREVLAALVKEKASDISDVGQAELYAQLDADITAAISAFSVKVDRLRTALPSEITRRMVLDACQIFQVTPPRPGQPVDMAMVKRKMRALVRAVHPDSHGHGDGNDMRIITEAKDLLERYNQKLKEGTP